MKKNSKTGRAMNRTTGSQYLRRAAKHLNVFADFYDEAAAINMLLRMLDRLPLT